MSNIHAQGRRNGRKKRKKQKSSTFVKPPAYTVHLKKKILW